MNEKKSVRILFLTLIIGLGTPSFVLASWGEFLPHPLTRSDFAKLREVTRTQLADKEPGYKYEWENSKTKLKGTSTLVKEFKIKDQPCREILHMVTFRDGEVLKFHGTLCQNNKGRWESLPFTFENR